MAIVTKAIYRLNTIPIKIAADFFAKMDRLILKSIWAQKGFRIAKIILKIKNKVGKLILSDLKTYYKITLINLMGRRIVFSPNDIETTGYQRMNLDSSHHIQKINSK